MKCFILFWNTRMSMQCCQYNVRLLNPGEIFSCTQNTLIHQHWTFLLESWHVSSDEAIFQLWNFEWHHCQGWCGHSEHTNVLYRVEYQSLIVLVPPCATTIDLLQKKIITFSHILNKFIFLKILLKGNDETRVLRRASLVKLPILFWLTRF